MNKKNLDLSIIIVNFNTKLLTVNCLQSIINAKKQNNLWEVIIVDNGSTDGSVDYLYKFIHDKQINWITLLPLKENVGFSSGNNKAISLSHGENILLLNSDTEVEHNAIDVSLELLLSSNKIGAVSCKLVLPDGTIDPACHRGFPTPWSSLTYFVGLESLFPKIPIFSQYHQWYKNINTTHEVDAISGGFFLIKREVIDDVGLLDESFFMYGEDLDWSYRIKKRGWQIWFTPQAVVLHKKKQSGRSNIDRDLRKRTQRYFYQTMKQFYKKHYMHTYPKVLTYLILFIINIRLLYVDVRGK